MKKDPETQAGQNEKEVIERRKGPVAPSRPVHHHFGRCVLISREPKGVALSRQYPTC